MHGHVFVIGNRGFTADFVRLHTINTKTKTQVIIRISQIHVFAKIKFSLMLTNLLWRLQHLFEPTPIRLFYITDRSKGILL